MKTAQRTARIEQRQQGGKTVYEASLSSELPVKRYGYTEILRHDENSINMDRARNGLVLLFNHDIEQPIGRVTDIGLRGDNKLSGRFTFSDTDKGRERQKQVDEGVLTDISIRYSIDDEERSEDEKGGDVFTVTEWTPMECSVCSVPADASVGIGRAIESPPNGEQSPDTGALLRAIQKVNEGITMDNKATPTGDSAAQTGVVNFDSARKAGATEGVQVERQRQSEINALFQAPKYAQPVYSALRDACLDDGSSIDQAQRKLLDLIGNETGADEYVAPQPKTEQGQRNSQVTITESGEDKIIEGMRKALDVKFNSGTAEELRDARKNNDFVGMSYGDMARSSLQLMGVENPMKYDVRTAIGYALNPLALPAGAVRDFVGHGSSVFTSLVENNINKELLKGFEEQTESWREFCQIGSVSSYRQESRVDLSTFPDLPVVPENGEYTHGTMSDRKEYITATKKGLLFSLSREVLVNDDTSALSRSAIAMGRAAERGVGDAVFSVLTTNAAMQDGVTLFHSTHANTRASGGAPSISELNEMEILMAKQTGLGGNGSGQNIDLAVLIVPRALKKTAQVLAMAVNDPDQINTLKGGGGTSPNPYAGNFKVVADARLDATSAAVYYGMGDPSRYDTIEVAFLNGQQTPTLESENGFTVDGITYKVRHEYGVKATSWYAMVHNAGA